jgi:hypothetical protein
LGESWLKANLGKNVHETPFPPYLNRKILDMVACTQNPSYGKKHEIGGLKSRLAWTKSKLSRE